MKLSHIQGVFLRYLYPIFRGMHSLSDLFYWPLIDILLWGITAVWLQQQQPSSYILPMLISSLLLWQITWRGSIDIGVSLLQEFWHRNLINLFSTPLTLIEWSIGVLWLSLTKLLITIGFGASAIYLLYSVNIFALGWSFLFFTITLIIFGWTVGFIAASAIIYYGHQMEALAWMIGFVFAPLSAVFYPIDVLPDWLQIISWALPTSYIFEAMRALMTADTYPNSYIYISLTLDIVYFIGAWHLFQYAFEKSRSKGLARLE